MIPFTLGFICGFAFSVLITIICVLCKACSMRSREEEEWVENIGRTMQGMSEENRGMSSALFELHGLEEEAVRREGKGEAGERTD